MGFCETSYFWDSMDALFMLRKGINMINKEDLIPLITIIGFKKKKTFYNLDILNYIGSIP